MKIKYYLSNKEYKNTAILISITHNSKRIFLTSNIVVFTNDWNLKTQRLKASANNSFDINDLLNKIEKHFYSKYSSTSSIDVRIIKKEMLNYIQNKDNSNNDSVFYHFDKYINEFLDSGKIRLSTSKQKKATLSLLKQFNPNIVMNDVNISLLEDFTQFLIKKDYTNVYVKRVIKMFKSFLNLYAVPNKLINNFEYKNFSLKEYDNNETAFVKLDEKELLILKDLQLNERLTKIRDLFLFQCYTGLRVSDLMNLKKENYNLSKQIIEVNTYKTSKNVQIPILPITSEILNKYNYNLPSISDVKYNKYLKELCKIAGFDNLIINYKSIGNKRIEYIKPKYDMITSHTARRTFIIMLLDKGMLPERIMKITGHTNRAVFDNYVRVTQNEAIDEMRNLF